MKFNRKIRRKTLKAAAFCLALLLIGGLVVFACMGTGNPVSYLMVSSAARQYVEEHYAPQGYAIEDISYDFKSVGYTVKVTNSQRMDGDFRLYYTMSGELMDDRYAYAVEGGVNTANRLQTDYREQVRKVLGSPAFPYAASMAYGNLKFSYEKDEIPPQGALRTSDLIPEHFYDVMELGARSGYLVLYVESDTATPEKAAEVLLGIKQVLEDAGIRFYAVEYFVLEPSRNADGAAGEGDRLSVSDLLYEDLDAAALADRIRSDCRIY